MTERGQREDSETERLRPEIYRVSALIGYKIEARSLLLGLARQDYRKWSEEEEMIQTFCKILTHPGQAEWCIRFLQASRWRAPQFLGYTQMLGNKTNFSAAKFIVNRFFSHIVK